jgi:hypothetical protein
MRDLVGGAISNPLPRKRERVARAVRRGTGEGLHAPTLTHLPLTRQVPPLPLAGEG